MPKESAITILKNLREEYSAAKRFHYLSFAAFVLILLLDIIIIIYVRAVNLDAYSWSGIILLFVLLSVEGIQYKKYARLEDQVDNFYLEGQYEYGG